MIFWRSVVLAARRRESVGSTPPCARGTWACPRQTPWRRPVVALLFAARADVTGDDLAKGLLFEDRVVDGDARLRSEQRGRQARDVLHLWVADDCDVDRARVLGNGAATDGG